MVKTDLEEILYSREEIGARVRAMGHELSAVYKDSTPVVICILKGSCIFFADLIRDMDIPMELDFITASSYGNHTETSGTVKVESKLSIDVRGRDVLLVEDIVDTGNTLNRIRGAFEEMGVATLKICTLLDKPDRREVPVHVDYTGFVIPDVFVVGYGLDYAQKYRNLPCLGILKEACYA